MRLTIVWLCAALILAPSGPAWAQSTHPKATVQQGQLVGGVENGVEVFKGLPFAAPPVGPLRWRPPSPAKAWSGDRDATQFSAGCPQPYGPNDGGPVTSSEDCLYLNVWAPIARPAAPLRPVMVWIHGGGWRGGHGGDPVFDGAAFAKDGVVLVTVNYRLGLLGFFAHPALTREAGPDAPLGDYGLMDNIAALQWVQRNIKAFGGDPGRVTVFGESAGAGQVLFLLTTPSAKGLFQQAIVESGPAFGRPRTLADGEAAGVALTGKLGLAPTATAEQLRALSPAALLSVQTTITPMVDGRLVKAPPQDVFGQNQQTPVPLIIGTNSDEGSLVRGYGAAADALLPAYGDQLETLKRLYGSEAPDAASLRREIFADTIFGAPARRIAAHASARAPAFLYRFDYIRQTNRAAWSAAQHASEIPFVFETLGPSATPQDEAMAGTIHACWTTFAKTGHPVCANAPAWPAYAPKTDTLMLFDRDGHAAPASDFDKPVFDFIQGYLLDRVF
jgi:para-nitrobenzyl esterase